MRYSIDELAKKLGLTRFIIRHYVNKGYLPRAIGAGANAHFTEEHVHRLLALRRLRSQKVKLVHAAQRVNAARGDALLELAGLPPPPRPAPAPPPPPTFVPPSEAAYRSSNARPREIWEHIAICPGVELRIRFDADTEARRVARTIEDAFAGR